MPYQIQEHFISEYPLWVQYEQSEDFKFLDRQRNYLAPHGNKVLLQAEIQITFPDFRQWLICLRRDKILVLSMGHQPEYCQPHNHEQTEPAPSFGREKAE